MMDEIDYLLMTMNQVLYFHLINVLVVVEYFVIKLIYD